MKAYIAAVFAIHTGLALAASSYDQVYPYYVEFCAVTQIRPLVGEAGGYPGHGVLYVKGACRDASRGYPRLKVCDQALDMTDPESGAGISVDRMFKNLNWMAVDGKSMLISAGLSSEKSLSSDAMSDIVKASIRDGLFEGIAVHDNYVKAAEKSASLTDYIAEQALGTNFGVALGRNAYCARVPIERADLPRVVDYLNAQNDQYREKTYNWSAFFDNCTHTTHNAIAAAGFWGRMNTRAFPLVQAFNMAIPANDFIHLMRTGNDRSLKNVLAVYRNKQQRRLLLEQGQLSVRPGVLLEEFNIHAAGNEVYQTEKSDFMIWDIPYLRPRRHTFNKILREDRYRSLEANLKFFEAKYLEALKARRSVAELQRRDVNGDTEELYSAEFQEFHRKYYAYIEQELAQVRAQLKEL